MEWIEVCDGFVRKDAIIDVHINQAYPGAVYVVLISGDSVKYKDFGENGFNSAKIAMAELMDRLTGRANMYKYADEIQR